MTLATTARCSVSSLDYLVNQRLKVKVDAILLSVLANRWGFFLSVQWKNSELVHFQNHRMKVKPTQGPCWIFQYCLASWTLLVLKCFKLFRVTRKEKKNQHLVTSNFIYQLWMRWLIMCCCLLFCLCFFECSCLIQLRAQRNIHPSIHPSIFNCYFLGLGRGRSSPSSNFYKLFLGKFFFSCFTH